jgi:hypothetical protein
MGWQDELNETIGRIPLAFEQLRTELQVGLTQFHNGARLRGARSKPVGTGGTPMVWAGPGRLVGWSVHNTGAGAASIVLHDSRDPSGEIVAVIDLASPAAWNGMGSSDSLWAGEGGVSFGEGLFATIVGTVEGAVWVGAVD